MISMLTCCVVASLTPQEMIPWQRNLVNAKSGARDSDMLIFAEFVDPEDPLLEQADALTFVGQPVQKALSNFVPVKVERAKEPLAFKQYTIRQTPVAYVIDAQGRVRGHFMLPQAPVDLVPQINRFMAADRDFIRSTNQALQGTVSRDVIAKAALAYAYRFDFPEANAMVERLKERGVPCEVMLVLGQAYALRGGAKTALFWFERGLKGAKTAPERAWAQRGIAESALALGDTNKARKAWQSLLDDAKASEVDQWIARTGIERLGKG